MNSAKEAAVAEAHARTCGSSRRSLAAPSPSPKLVPRPIAAPLRTALVTGVPIRDARCRGECDRP